MKMKQTIGLIGGDRRQAELAGLLAQDGHPVRTYGLEEWLPESGCALEQAAAAGGSPLPPPLCREPGILNCCGRTVSTAEVFRLLRPDALVLGGQIQAAQRAEASGVVLHDYFRREEVTVANAAATAEAALRVAMEHSGESLLGMECLVLGFGRIGKLLCSRLHGLGARVTAAARKPADLAWIRAYGWQPLEITRLDGALGAFHLVYNTVPAQILDRPLLLQLPRRSLCVELASVPGIDLTAAEELGLSCVWARSLPGRMVPRTAAEILHRAVRQIILEERGNAE